MSELAEGCGCCAGVEVETPRTIHNRSGLSSVAYRIGDHARFRASLLSALTGSKLATRQPGDFSVALIDAFACAADVLTFYQERLANESFLGTATERVSLQELGKLVGYRLRPGLAAETWLAFALETPPETPEELRAEPGGFVTGVPSRISLPAGIQVRSVPGPDEEPQTFETVEALAGARPEWNGLRPWLAAKRGARSGDVAGYFAGVGNNLAKGDALLFVAGPAEFQLRVLTGVELDAKHDRTQVSWQRPLSGFSEAAEPSVFVLRRRLAMFGHDRPAHLTATPVVPAPAPAPASGGKGGEVGAFPTEAEVDPGAAPELSLDGVFPDILQGSWVVLAQGPLDYPEGAPPAGARIGLFRVQSVSEVSRTRLIYPNGSNAPLHTFSSKVTHLEFDGESANAFSPFRSAVHTTTVFAASERLVSAQYPVGTLVSGDRIPVAGGTEELAGRRVIVRGTLVDGASFAAPALVVEAKSVEEGAVLRIEPAISREKQLVRASVVVHANVALASHGETVSELLGAGDASQTFQSFDLKHLPLTHRAAENEVGARPEITLRVSDVAWSEKPSLYGASPSEPAYSLAVNEHGQTLARFGDGVNGARLPSGVNNVRVKYRKGLGAQGNVGAEQLSQLVSRPLGLKGTTNPLRAEGGTDPETADAARASIPITTRTLGRVVSLLDYADFARAFGGVAKAEAALVPLSGGNAVAVTIAGAGGGALGPTSPVWRNLLGALRTSGDPSVPLRLLACKLEHFEVAMRVKTDPAYDRAEVLAAVEASLRARFSFERQELGEPVQSSVVIATAQANAGVVAVDLDALHLSREAPALHLRLLAARTHFAGGVAKPAELLVLNPGAPLRLEELS